jgi:crossover junction endodeoxyribonuclease RuvC
MRILGIDPGSRVTGYGLIESDGRTASYLVSGAIRTPTAAFPERLAQIYAGIREVCEAYRPQAVAIERVFVARNADSALKLGQARAAAICATFGLDTELHEYAAREVKNAIVGSGAAEKSQVAHMVVLLLRQPRRFDADEADALAIALCHAHCQPLKSRLASLRAAGARP